MPNQPRKNNPARTIRVNGDLWEAAMVRAAERGEPLSEAIRRFLNEYTRPLPDVCSQCGRPNPGHWCDSCGWQR